MNRILGIDLAAQARSTGVVVLSRRDLRWDAEEPSGAATDDRLVELAVGADLIGIDAPLGWPVAFVTAIADHAGDRPWPGGPDRSSLTHRETDRAVHAMTGRLPLSASADRLGICTMRCALLQHRWATEVWGGPAPRDGSGRLIETYPAGALRAWDIGVKGYKGATAERAGTAPSVRAEIIDRIGEACPWLELDRVRARCVASDHVLDALVCCLVALAAAVRATATPTDADAARAEGWIHVPTASLASLQPPEP